MRCKIVFALATVFAQIALKRLLIAVNALVSSETALLGTAIFALIALVHRIRVLMKYVLRQLLKGFADALKLALVAFENASSPF